MPLGHIGVNVPDLEAARSYYDDMMPLVGFEPFLADAGEFSYRPVEAKPGTFIFFYRALEPCPGPRRATPTGSCLTGRRVRFDGTPAGGACTLWCIPAPDWRPQPCARAREAPLARLFWGS
jgi:catechol 2,3-dioxygenase-like lactoylglutathione lyase family enzyme